MLNKKEFKKIGPMKLPCLLRDGKIVEFKLHTYKFPNEEEYYVLEKGDVRKLKNPLVRIHSACSFAQVFGSQRCDCKFQLDESMTKIAKEGGLIIYIWSHEGRGIGKWNHTKVYMEQDKGEDTVTAYEVLDLPIDQRNYSNAIKILKDYEFKEIRLLTNNPRKINPFEGSGIKVTRIPLVAKVDKYNESQIKIKISKLGHYSDIVNNNNK